MSVKNLLILIIIQFFYGSIGQSSVVACSSVYLNNNKEYSSYSELRKYQKEGVDFKITESFVESPITIIAPHGGLIEFGTSEIARMIAGTSFNLYLFEGIKSNSNFELHITSDNFDEPRAIRIMKRSVLGISIHGFKNDKIELIAIGGANKFVGAKLAIELQKIGINIDFPSTRFKGESLENIVNKSKNYGVQLELSSRLRENFLSNSDRLIKFCEIIRLVLKN